MAEALGCYLGWGMSDEGMDLFKVLAKVEDNEGLAKEVLKESGVSWMKILA